MITIALPKGRIADDTLKIFKTIFRLDFAFEDRKLIMQEGDFKFLYVRNQDIPTYIAGGAADIGVVGLEVMARCTTPPMALPPMLPKRFIPSLSSSATRCC